MKHYKDILNLNQSAKELSEAKGIPNPNTFPDQNPRPVQGDHRIAPTKANADQDKWKAQYLQADARMRQHIQYNKDEIEYLKKKIAADTKKLETARKKAEKGDYKWGATELWHDSFGM